MRRLIGLAGLLVLAACGEAETPDNSAAPSPTPRPGPKLAGVDLDKPLCASGGEWTLDIAPGRLTYQARKDAAPVELYPRSPSLSEGHARFVTETPAGEAVTIDLSAQPCKDAPLTADIAIGARKLSGCAQPR